MEEMAATLNAFAGGLQQSFATVFERVGQSLEQSAQMMHMMNDVMEAALLQSLHVACRFDAVASQLQVTVANRSQIALADVVLSVRVADGAAVDSAPLFSTSFASLPPGDEQVVLVQLPHVPVAGEAELVLRSPGTQAPLCKRCAFRVSLFESLAFQAVPRGDAATDSFAIARSATVDLQDLRRVLRLSPLDAMLTADVGSYRFSVASAGVSSFYLSVTPGSGGASEIVIAAAVSESASEERDPEARRRACETLIEELEAATQSSANASN
ncbi:hypothetical protein PybrP1_001097 [[Pythium] brassicae (nom. inval.)]|nr:hypothetical protein PybrP1_001097 [[Pythium] brassicae (nom. inval.)]